MGHWFDHGHAMNTTAGDALVPAASVEVPGATKSAGPAPGDSQKLYHVGTLTYTRAALVNVFCWMLWGDLCLNVMESVIPRMVPLQLQKLGASDALIGILTGSIFSLMNWVMNPWISTWSDRHRSRLGRRIPFLLFPTPPLALFLTAVGFSSNIAGYIGKTSPATASAIAHVAAHLLPDVSKLSGAAQLTIGVFTVTLVLYKFFDLFPQCTYYYLFTDVIPQKLMGTFVCFFRLAATLGGVIFHEYILRYADTYPRMIYLGCALLYLLAFTLLSVMVKEGAYPPPPPKMHHPVKKIGRWFGESFGNGFYWRCFLSSACFRWAFVPFNAFLILYAKKQLHMDPGQFGHAMALVMIVQLPILLFLGPLLDRFHPLRVGIFGYSAMAAASVIAFFFIHDSRTFLVFALIEFATIAVIQSSLSTIGPRLMPRQRYGQFCAANAMVVESGLLVLSWLCGEFLDRVGERYVHIWAAVFAMIGFFVLLNLFFAWKRHGGDENFVAPGDFPVPSPGTPGEG